MGGLAHSDLRLSQIIILLRHENILVLFVSFSLFPRLLSELDCKCVIVAMVVVVVVVVVED